MLGCLKCRLTFWPLLPALGAKLERISAFRPLAKVSLSSTLVARRLAVFHDWVMLMPANGGVSRLVSMPVVALLPEGWTM